MAKEADGSKTLLDTLEKLIEEAVDIERRIAELLSDNKYL